MSVRSAGIALWRRNDDGVVEVLLGRFGGPYWKNRRRAWGIPKGEYDPAAEDASGAARREFAEETGFAAPPALEALGEFPIGSGKTLEAFAAEGDVDPAELESNRFSLEWPPNSGIMQAFAEISEARWFPLEEAVGRVVKSQVPVIEALAEVTAGRARS